MSVPKWPASLEDVLSYRDRVQGVTAADGPTPRDWYAMVALIGFMERGSSSDVFQHTDIMIANAYAVADRVLKIRRRKKPHEAEESGS